MKKSIFLILFVLISTMSFSQTVPSGVIASIDNQAFVSLHQCNPSWSGNPFIRDTIYVKSSASIITIDFDAVLSNPSYTNPAWIGSTYSLIMTGVTGGTIKSGVVQTSGNTFTFNAVLTSLSTGFEYIYLKLPGNGTVSPPYANGQVVSFVIKHNVDPFNITSTFATNQVTFNWSRLSGSNLSAYVYDSSPNAPLGIGTVTNITNLSYNISPSDTIGHRYLHIRSTDTTIFTAWYTYKIKLQYTPPTTVGIAEQTLSNFKVYPNPAKDFITVQYTSANNIENVSLYNIAGQEMTSQAVESMGDNKVTFNVESYPQGIYFARIGSSTYKFIKQ